MESTGTCTLQPPPAPARAGRPAPAPVAIDRACALTPDLVDLLRFIIPAGQRVLALGPGSAELPAVLRANTAAVWDPVASEPAPEWHALPDWSELAALEECFEYIVLLGDGETDIEPPPGQLFADTATRCTPTGRLLLVDGPARSAVRQATLQRAATDAGWERMAIRHVLDHPTTVSVWRPPTPAGATASRKTASVVVAVRDERDNIEPIVESLPQLGGGTEIIMVEGHSRDGTREEIHRVMRAYPDKHVRLIEQTGRGPGNAILEGFDAATGDVILLFEGDQTSRAADLTPIFDMLATGDVDFVNGTRFVLPHEQGAMPLRNRLGNWAFARWASWFLRQPLTDVFCGLKGFDRTQYQKVRRNWGFLQTEDPFSDLEMLLGAARLTLKIAESPTRYHPRPYGATKTRFYSQGWQLAKVAAAAQRMFRWR